MLPIVIHHYVSWFDIAMHDAHTMARVQGQKQLEHVVAHSVIWQSSAQFAQVNTVNVFKD